MIKTYPSKQHFPALNKITNKKNLINYTFYLIIFSFILRFLANIFIGLIPEEAYYWNYAQHLDFGYLDHPPMVALLIRLPTMLFGNHEFFVRLSSIICWLLTAFFIFKFSNLIKKGTGIFSVLLLSILPFFFLQSLVITPDNPLMACWAACIYYFYRALVLNEAKSWYRGGIWLGLGLFSKYTIVLLGPCVLLYILLVPSSRYWLTRKEPYLCALIALICLLPVLYWNATHEWASFLFQSTRRFKSQFSFSFHKFFGLILLFLMPLGVIDLFKLYKKNKSDVEESRFFLQLFTFIPLVFFGMFSLTHEIKFNWTGPGLLPLIPWLAMNMMSASKLLLTWLLTAFLLLAFYCVGIFSIVFGNSNLLNQKLFKNYFAWNNLVVQINLVAEKLEATTLSLPILVPLGLYNINSELAYYQKKLLDKKKIAKNYPVEGRHLFGDNSLMYNYWAENKSFSGKTLILISTNPSIIESPEVRNRVIEKSAINSIWAYNQGGKIQVKPYFYRIVQMI